MPSPELREAVWILWALLGALALGDLRVELLLLADHFTFTSFSAALLAHPLAVAVLVLMPSLVRHYR